MMELSPFNAFPALFFAFALFFFALPTMMAASWFAFSHGRMQMGPMPSMPWAMMRGPLSMSSDWSAAEQTNHTSGSRAFDAYKAETLARLDEEEKAFAAFRERLRAAHDRAEFDSYLNERSNSDAPAHGPKQPETDT